MADKTVGDIVVRVGADISLLEQGMNKAANVTTSFSKDAVKKLKGVTKNVVAMGAAATAAAAGGLTALTVSASEAGREIINLSMAANTSTTEFQKFAFAAGNLGIEQDKLADILKDVNDRVGDFLTTGGGPMADFFEQIAPKVGVTAQMFKDLSGPDALQLYVSSLEAANVNQQEMTFFLEAMASDLTVLLPLLQDNGKLLAESASQAEKMGIVLSEFDLAQLEKAQQNFTEMRSVISGVSDLIGAKLAPFLNELFNRFSETGIAGQSMGDMIDQAIRKSVRGAAFLADVVQGLRVVFKGVELVAVGFGAAVVESINGIIRGFNFLIEQVNRIPGAEFQKLDEISHGLVDRIRELRTELGAMAMEPLPSDQIEEFLNSVSVSAQQTAMEIGDARRSLVELNTQANAEIASGDKKAAKAKEKLTKQQWAGIAIQTSKAMQSILGTMAQGNRRAFELAKAWAYADALMSTYQGIAKGVAQGFPQGIPAIAWATANGFAQVQAIQSMNFNGGGSKSTSSTSAPTSSAPAPAPAATPAGSNQTLTIAPIDPNAIFSGGDVQVLAERLRDFSRDGGDIVFQ